MVTMANFVTGPFLDLFGEVVNCHLKSVIFGPYITNLFKGVNIAVEKKCISDLKGYLHGTGPNNPSKLNSRTMIFLSWTLTL